MVARARRGRSTLGCLFTLLILATIGYFAVGIGRVYLHYYEFQDAMSQEARFAAHNTDSSIVLRLQATADSLNLPNGASRVHVRRTPSGTIFIWAEYVQSVEFPGFVRDIDFTPHVERAF